jgi:hypothetical protein
MNMLGEQQRFDVVPFFWSQHYDVTIQYIGHADQWDAIEIQGSLTSRDCSVSYMLAGRTYALATIGRDRVSLSVEQAMETSNGRSRRVDAELDEALAMTFPASDPVAIDRSIA